MSGRSVWSDDQQTLTEVDLIALVVRLGVQHIDHRAAIECDSNRAVCRDLLTRDRVAQEWQHRRNPIHSPGERGGHSARGGHDVVTSIDMAQCVSPEKAS